MSASTNARSADDEGADTSGVLGWAGACRENGTMRPWIDIDGHACVGQYSFNAGLPPVDHVNVILWTASLILLNHIERHMSDSWAGKRVLELSAGERKYGSLHEIKCPNPACAGGAVEGSQHDLQE